MKAAKAQSHVKIEFHHAGVACPCCGYVFNLGFSDLTLCVPGQGGTSRSATVTVCSRCRTRLKLERGSLVKLDALDEIALTPQDHLNLRYMEDLIAASVAARGKQY